MPLQCAPIFFKSKDSRDEVGAGRFVFPKPLGLLLVALCEWVCVGFECSGWWHFFVRALPQHCLAHRHHFFLIYFDIKEQEETVRISVRAENKNMNKKQMQNPHGDIE